MSKTVDPQLAVLLRCPADGSVVRVFERTVRCDHGHVYPVVQGVPILLAPSQDETLWVRSASLKAASDVLEGRRSEEDYFVDTLGCTPEQRTELAKTIAGAHSNGIDPIASYLIVATGGNMYRNSLGRLTRLPIPSFEMPPGNGARLLDIGCNWGRWCHAASARGYRVVGLDPSLGAVLAAQRIAARLGTDAMFVVGDALCLPFWDGSFDVCHSYSVLQHFGRESVERALDGIRCVLARPGMSLIQMANREGVRSLYQQMRRGFGTPQGFDVRYWSSESLYRTFTSHVGPTTISADCFLGLGIQPEDTDLYSAAGKVVAALSSGLTRVSRYIPMIARFADSLYLRSTVQ